MNETYNTISSVVEECLSDIGELGGHRFQQFLGWAFRGLQELYLDAGRQTCVVKLNLSRTKTSELPPGFVDWTKVSFEHSGRVRLLSRASGKFLSYALPAGGSEFELLGKQADATPFFTIDLHANQIMFSSKVSTRPVYLEFIGDGFAACCNENVLVHPYVRDYLTKYVHFKRVDLAPGSTEAEVFRRSEDLHYAEKKARGRLLGLTMEELMAISR